MGSVETPKPFDIAVVGGGIAGLTLTIGLLKHGISVTLYEAAAQFGEIGAGVGFHPFAVKAMELIHPGVREAFLACANPTAWSARTGEPPNWFVVRTGDRRIATKEGLVKGKEKEGLKVGDVVFDILSPAGERGGVHRAHYLDQLVKLVPEDICRFKKRLLDIKQADDGSGDAVLQFEDGTSARHTAVLGCDGIKSKTRNVLLGGKDRAVFSGKYAYRGLVPMDKAIQIIGEEKTKKSQMWMGYHGHILTFPIAKGKILNLVAFSSKPEWTDPRWVVPTTKQDLLKDYEHWDPMVLSLLAEVQNPDIWALFNHPPAPTYISSDPRICLVGDAAHASTPHQGSGACMCIEDSYILSSLIGEAQNVTDLNKAFKVYDEVRRERTQKLVTTSKEAAQLYEFESDAGDDIDKVYADFSTRMDWIWLADMEKEWEKARTLYASEV